MSARLLSASLQVVKTIAMGKKTILRTLSSREIFTEAASYSRQINLFSLLEIISNDAFYGSYLIRNNELLACR